MNVCSATLRKHHVTRPHSAGTHHYILGYLLESLRGKSVFGERCKYESQEQSRHCCRNGCSDCADRGELHPCGGCSRDEATEPVDRERHRSELAPPSLSQQ